ncbi:MAG: hypothetical protein ACW990_20035 [Promethearchaeota archaeon]|jgi:hypothetical protein
MSQTDYPKEIITIEKVTPYSLETTEVKTIVQNGSEENAVQTAISFMTSFNDQNNEGCSNACNFPHARVGIGGKLTVTDKPPIQNDNFFKWFTKDYGWNHSGWDYRKVIQSDLNKVHLEIQFSRYRADGSKIGVFPSLWIITNHEGHWGIKMRSSFAP